LQLAATPLAKRQLRLTGTAYDGSAPSNPTATLPVLDASWGNGGDTGTLTILPSFYHHRHWCRRRNYHPPLTCGPRQPAAVLLDAALLASVTAAAATTPLPRLQQQLALASSTGVAPATSVSDTATSVGRTFEV